MILLLNIMLDVTERSLLSPFFGIFGVEFGQIRFCTAVSSAKYGFFACHSYPLHDPNDRHTTRETQCQGKQLLLSESVIATVVFFHLAMLTNDDHAFFLSLEADDLENSYVPVPLCD